jgi:hypothetical protein
MIFIRAGRRGAAEDELVGGKAGPLIGLKHVVCPAILHGYIKIRIQDPGGIIHITELGVT